MNASRWLVPALAGGCLLCLTTIARAAEDAAPAANAPATDNAAESAPADTAPPTDASDTIAAPANDLGMNSALRHYADWLTRHPSRIASPADFDTAGADAAMRRNWRLFYQAANIGIDDNEGRSDWRHRAGGVADSLILDGDRFHAAYQNGVFANPLLNNILDIDHAFVGGYEAPLPGLEPFRAGVVGTWSDLAHDPRDAFAGERYTGRDWSIAAELVYRLDNQPQNRTIDLVGGYRYRYEEMTAHLPGADVSDDIRLHMPYGGVRAHARDAVHACWAELMFEGAFTDNNQDVSSGLGRLDTAENWAMLRFDIGMSLYAEAICSWINGRGLTAPTDRPLMHELWFGTHGQVTLGDQRLPLYNARAITGQYGVRGYDQSVLGGDDTVVANFEYRLHLAPLLPVQAQPAEPFGKPFRVARQTPAGTTDWDLILVAFFDVGYVSINDSRSFELDSDSIAGTGLGIELIPCAHMHVRANWAWALNEIPGVTSKGSSQFHLAATLVY